ncbi:MAG: Imm49 family immunity protein [Myxococcota bacterium]
MQLTILEQAGQNYEGHLAHAVDLLGGGSTDPATWFNAAHAWRVLALCHLLQTADGAGFQDRLRRSAQARLAFLGAVRDGLEAPPRFVCASKDVSFTAALAGGDLELARRIAELSRPSRADGVEYEDDFLYIHVLQRLAVDPEAGEEHEALLARWEEVLEGAASGPLDACRGLVVREDEAFAEGIESLVRWRQACLESYRDQVSFDPELFATEGRVDVEGLAVLRLAEERGLSTRPEYPLLPSVARVPLAVEPLPDDAWLDV